MSAENENDSLRKRKLQLTDFKDLFSALFKINDRAVQERVLAAINGIVDPTNCLCGSIKNTNYKSISTQTEEKSFAETIEDHKCEIKIIKVTPRILQESPSHSLTSEISLGLQSSSKNKMEQPNEEFHVDNDLRDTINSDETNALAQSKLIDSGDRFEELPSRKRRRRDKKVPRVEKSVPINVQNNSNLLIKNTSTSSTKQNERPLEEIILNREINNLDPIWISNLDNMLSDKSPVFNNGKVDEKVFTERMRDEYNISSKIVDAKYGYLPIHKAIKENDFKKLILQLFVYNFKKIKVLNLRTQGESRDDPLQLAIKCNSIIKIFEILFKSIEDKSECFQSLDIYQNTLLHLCILNADFELNTFKLVLKNLDDVSIFQDQNDDGLTVLHLATLHKKTDMLHLMLIKIDKLLNLISNEDYEKLYALRDQQLLHNYYVTKIQDLSQMDVSKFNEKKFVIMNTIETKSGRNSLFFSLQSKNELSSLMLLANLCDPSKPDYSGSNSMEINNVEDILLVRATQHVENYLSNHKQWKLNNL